MQQYNLVEQLPESILCFFCEGRQYTITGISNRFVRVRVSKDGLEEFTDWLTMKKVITISYLDYGKQEFEKVRITNYQESDVVHSRFFAEVILEIPDSKDYEEMVDFVVSQYTRYVFLKMDSYDNSFSEKLCAYPAKEDETLTESLTTFVDQELSKNQIRAFFNKVREAGMELACYETDRFFKEKELFDRIYVGSEYCMHRVPGISELKKKMQLVRAAGKNITIQLPPCKESEFSFIHDLMELLLTESVDCSGKNPAWIPELVVNDWGTLAYIDRLMKDKPVFVHVVAGTLLLKARKDPRDTYRICPNFHMQEKIREAQYEQVHVQRLLKEQGIERIEVEGHLSGKQSDFLKSYHFPMYQTNTSSFCTLKAIVESGDRNRQVKSVSCSGLCERYFLAYPEHLKMVGIGNSLLALQKDWEKEEFLTLLKEKHINRIVWNLSF